MNGTIEKELVRELESLRYLKRTPNGVGSQRKPPANKLDVYVKNLESECDFYKREINTLQELLKASPGHQSRRESSSSPSKSPSAKSGRIKSNSPSKQTAAPRCSVCAGRSMSPSQQHLAIEEIKKLKREKDDLKLLLDKFEGYMEQVGFLYYIQ